MAGKKPYPGKPDIIFESFELSTNIMAGCEVMGNFADEKTCGWEHPYYGDTVFADKFYGPCEFYRPGGGYEWGGLHVCVSVHESVLFSS